MRKVGIKKKRKTAIDNLPKSSMELARDGKAIARRYAKMGFFDKSSMILVSIPEIKAYVHAPVGVDVKEFRESYLNKINYHERFN